MTSDRIRDLLTYIMRYYKLTYTLLYLTSHGVGVIAKLYLAIFCGI